MLNLALPFLVLLTAPAQEGPEDAPIWAEPACSWFTPTLSMQSVLQQEQAPQGSAWWLRRLDVQAPYAPVSLLQNPADLILVDGSGNIQSDFNLHVSHAAMALTVPSDALPGANYLLRKVDSESQSILLQVGTDMAETGGFTLVHLAADTPNSPEDCTSECFVEGFTLPWALAVDLEFQGAPLVADVWFRSMALEDEDYSLLEERLIDSQYLPAGRYRLQASSYFEGEASMYVRVELRSPQTLALLHGETFELDPVPSVPFEPPEEERMNCEDYEEYYQDDAFAQDCSCSGTAMPVTLFVTWGFGWLLAAWVPRRLRRKASQS